jgi:putative PIN family toxin of toxin-antitoxin system
MNRNSLPNVVFDTNAIISAAIIPASVSRRALLHASESFQLVHSDATWQELSEVITRKKFDRYFNEDGRNEFLLLIARISKITQTATSVTDCPDPKDNKFLELAIDANARIIVSGDGHLKNMHPFRDIAIMTPADFLGINHA